MSYSDISFSSGSWAGSRVLKFHSETATHVNFALTSSDGVNFAFSNPLEGGLAVERLTNTWSDLNTSSGNFPAISSQSSSSVTLANQFGSVRGVFSKPAQSTWGGGTSTSSGVGFTASFYDVTSNSFSYEVTHTSAFTSPQTYELHSTTLTPTLISDLVVAGASGSSNSRSHTWSTPDVIQIRDAYGTIGAELTLSHSASGPKKVFCNFW